jgi:biotin operon repressor
MDQQETNYNGKARDLRDGDWYWVHKTVIKAYAADMRAMGIAVYSCLAVMADRNQECFPSQQYIADVLGYSRATINKALKILRERGLIAVKKRNGCHCVYRLLKVRCKARETQLSKGGNSGVNQGDTNNNKLTRIINNIGNDSKKSGLSLSDKDGVFTPETREKLLALDIANGLKDRPHLSRYLSLANRYPEPILRRILSETKQVPDIKIRKSRAALFNHLLKKYVQETNHDPGDQSRN